MWPAAVRVPEGASRHLAVQSHGSRARSALPGATQYAGHCFTPDPQGSQGPRDRAGPSALCCGVSCAVWVLARPQTPSEAPTPVARCLLQLLISRAKVINFPEAAFSWATWLPEAPPRHSPARPDPCPCTLPGGSM